MPAGKRAAPTPVYLARTGAALGGVYRSDHGEGQHGSRLKWLVSTCLAAAVGVCAIGFAIYGSMENRGAESVLASLERVGREVMQPHPSVQRRGRQLRVRPKTNLLQTSARGLSTKHIIHDTLRQQRNSRQFIAIKPYARIVARLATSSPRQSDLIPAFNPLKLYALTEADRANKGDSHTTNHLNVAVKVLELVGGLLPEEDGQELQSNEVAALVALAGEEYDGPFAIRQGYDNEISDFAEAESEGESGLGAGLPERLPPHTTMLAKNVLGTDGEDTIEGQESRVFKVRKGDTLIGLLRRSGAESWQARAIVEASKQALGKRGLTPGDKLNLTLAPSPTRQFGLEPVRVSLVDKGNRHKFTVLLNDAGDYVASRAELTLSLARMLRKSPKSQRASLYRSLYHSALLQNLPPKMIMRVLRTHAYDTDFKRRVGPGDGFEVFYDLEDDGKGGEGRPGALLFTSITAGGETRKFYRYRSPDGVVDYYDDKGNSAKKFLMRKPVKGATVRFTSSFGYRIHPLLRRRKMHTGVDWAAKPGTPILAAGNGAVEAAGRKGGNGNYVRLRHANGYKTSYSHMRRIAKGLRKGLKVRQGQIIGYVGTTGLSSGPHLHYEVLVNGRPVNPMRINVPRGRKLKGKQLAEFQKARMRINELMSKSPVTTRIAQVDRIELRK